MSLLKIGEKVNNDLTPSKRGVSCIRIVDDNQNKRVSDIFNRRKEPVYQSLAISKVYKKRMIEISEKLIDDKLRSSSPYIYGQRNGNFTPVHMNSSFDITLSNRPSPTGKKIHFTIRSEKKEKNNFDIFGREKTPVKKYSHLKTNSLSRSFTANKFEEKKDIELDQNEKNEMYLEQRKNSRLKKQEDLTRSATLSLISKQYNPTENLSKKFEKSKGLFGTELTRDHMLEKAKENYQKNFSAKKQAPALSVNNTFKAKKNLLFKEQRLEIIDYYEMNQKIIDSKIHNPITQEENEKFFKDIKKINCVIVEKERMKKKEERDKDIALLKSSKSFVERDNSKYIRIATPNKLQINNKNSSIVHRSASKIDVSKKLDFSQSNISRSPIRK